MPLRLTLPALALFVLFTAAPACAQAPVAAKAQAAVKRDKIDPLTPAKKRVVDAFIDSLEIAQHWPRYVEESQQRLADDVRAGIVSGARLDSLPPDKRARVDAAVDEMVPHIVADMKAELLKVDAAAFYHGVGYDVYGKRFATRELKALTALYASPAYHRAMPRILEQRQAKPETSDAELRALVGDSDFDTLSKLMHDPAYTKLLSVAPVAQEATSEYIGALVADVSARVGRNYSPILLEKMREIMNEAPPADKPTSAQADAPAAAENATR